ncbi:hypothetical protein BU14_0389s0004 [Porphyra umbilicalis]|uniref:Uncharacterized protein n=1 Tax=Porphyra umbilicalis TaxID=2786 RepID=A0A1X6NWI7_PORUM|nr:hypothetical protein BU14_0389s0004 [Porphyra umbilicalis]|eukprot:OSX72981.1 hypothetical protein BU14_0389s0004 [Porphyra umbilicalis]
MPPPPPPPWPPPLAPLRWPPPPTPAGSAPLQRGAAASRRSRWPLLGFWRPSRAPPPAPPQRRRRGRMTTPWPFWTGPWRTRRRRRSTRTGRR